MLYVEYEKNRLTDNWSPCISGRRRMAIEMFSWPSLHERSTGCGDRTWGRLHAKRTRFRSSYRARLIVPYKVFWTIVAHLLYHDQEMIRQHNTFPDLPYRDLRRFSWKLLQTQYLKLSGKKTLVFCSFDDAVFNLIEAHFSNHARCSCQWNR